MKILPWEKDRWLSHNGNVLVYDKLEHFLIAFILVVAIARLFTGVSAGIVAGFVFLLGLAKEIRDGLVPYKDGLVEGFSWKDMLANVAGIATGWWFTGMSG